MTLNLDCAGSAAMSSSVGTKASADIKEKQARHCEQFPRVLIQYLCQQLKEKQMKLKKAHLVYFVQKDTPLRMDYRFNYECTPESALKYRLAQWIRGDNGKLKKRIF